MSELLNSVYSKNPAIQNLVSEEDFIKSMQTEEGAKNLFDQIPEADRKGSLEEFTDLVPTNTSTIGFEEYMEQSNNDPALRELSTIADYTRTGENLQEFNKGKSIKIERPVYKGETLSEVHRETVREKQIEFIFGISILLLFTFLVAFIGWAAYKVYMNKLPDFKRKAELKKLQQELEIKRLKEELNK